MYLFDLQAKLKKLNPGLYVKTDRRVEIKPGIFSSAIALRNFKRTPHSLTKAALNYADQTQRVRLEDANAGHLEAYMGGASLDWTPEYDEIDLETGAIIRRGWRSIALDLVKKGACSLEQARKVFGSSLGEYAYDRLASHEKLAWARKEAGYKNAF